MGKQIDQFIGDVDSAKRKLTEVNSFFANPSPENLVIAARMLETVSKELAWTSVETQRLAQRLEDMRIIQMAQDDTLDMGQHVLAPDNSSGLLDSIL